MSAYVTLAQIKAGLPDEITAQLLDDTGAGTADGAAWAAIVAAVAREINGKVGQRYTLPFTDPQPDILCNAAFVLAAELCYQRKGFYGDANPWTERADGIRGTVGQKGGQEGLLDRIASGDLPLTTTTKKANAPAVAVLETSKVTPAAGGTLM